MDTLNLIIGTKEDDLLLLGTAGTDILLGLKGDDVLDGGAGNDLLLGGKGDDLLDGGAGSDVILAGKGDDTVNFTLSANLGAMDFYNGGKGLDTLQLTLTSAEQQSFQTEIDAFKKFLVEGGKIFEFSFGLIVRNFEVFNLVTIDDNTAPVANPDLGVLVSEDAVDFSIDVLANDTDEDGNTLSLVTAVVTDGLGTATIDGDQVVYNPGDAYQFLGAGASANVRIDYTISDGEAEASSFVEIQVNGVNDAPVANDDQLGNLTATKLVSPINVAVIGGVGIQGQQSTYVDVVNDLNLNPAMFTATGFAYARDYDWTELLTYNVVVIGDSSGFDYANEKEDPATGESGTLFTTLEGFVKSGGGVVTTGLFASALESIFIPTNGMSIDVQDAADFITPITPDGAQFASSVINVIPGHQDIVGDVQDIAGDVPGIQYAVQGGLHELAVGFDGNQIATSGEFTAIAYDDFGTTGGGRTVYLGTAHLAAQEAPFNPSATRDGPVAQIFEQAIAWAAGARGSATVNIEGADLLALDTDVENDPLTIGFVSPTSALGGAITFDQGEIKIVYALDQIQAGDVDSFSYRAFDGELSSAPATVDFTVDAII